MSSWLPGPLVELLDYLADYLKQDASGFLSICELKIVVQ